MDGPQAIIALIVLALMLTGGAIAFAGASQTTAAEREVTNTSTAGGVGSVVAFNASEQEGAYYSESATVTNATDATLEGNATDYTWDETNGTLRVESSAAANQKLTATFTVYERTERQQGVSQILGNLVTAGAWLPLVVIFGLVVMAITTFGGLT